MVRQSSGGDEQEETASGGRDEEASAFSGPAVDSFLTLEVSSRHIIAEGWLSGR